MVKFITKFSGHIPAETMGHNYLSFAQAAYNTIPRGWSKGKCTVKCVETECVEQFWFTGVMQLGFNGQLDYQIERMDFNHPHYLDEE